MDRHDQTHDPALRGQSRLPRGAIAVSVVGHQPDARAPEFLAGHVVPAGPNVYDRGALESSLKMRRALSPRISVFELAGRSAQRTRATSRRGSISGLLLPNSTRSAPMSVATPCRKSW